SVVFLLVQSCSLSLGLDLPVFALDFGFSNVRKKYFLTMSSVDTAISLQNISKAYRLYGSLREQVLDVFGLTKLRFWRSTNFAEHWAVKDINLEVKRGERIGLIGRNGAGKTTLLKMITGNFMPTRGDIFINGSVQALMHVGLGFHPEFSGYENI